MARRRCEACVGACAASVAEAQDEPAGLGRGLLGMGRRRRLVKLTSLPKPEASFRKPHEKAP